MVSSIPFIQSQPFPAASLLGVPMDATGMHPQQLFPQQPSMLPPSSFGQTAAMNAGFGFPSTASAFNTGMGPLQFPASTSAFVMGPMQFPSSTSAFGMPNAMSQFQLPQTPVMPPMPQMTPPPMFPAPGPQANAGAQDGDNPLRASLNKIESDPEGAKLIQAARAKGVFIEVGDPSQARGTFDINAGGPQCSCALCGSQQTAADGTTTLSGVTISDSNGKSKITVSDPNNLKTIVHELVHAVSAGDDNSKDEEGIAEVIGTRVAGRLGAPVQGGSEQQIFQNKQQFYPTLNQSNNIRQTLAGLGLNITV